MRSTASRISSIVEKANKPLPVGASPAASLDETDPIEPRTLVPDADASIYGTGLDAVVRIRVDGSPARIQEWMPGRVQFTVPDVGPGDVEIEIVLGDGTLLTRADGTNLTAEVEGVGYVSERSTKGRRS